MAAEKRLDDDPAARETKQQGLLVGVRVALEPRDTLWELYTALKGSSVSGLFGWILSSSPDESGAPPELAELLARSLCEGWRVTFLDSPPDTLELPSSWTSQHGAWRRIIKPSPSGMRARPPAFPLTCTSDPGTASRLFQVGDFPWEQKGQVVLLSSLQAAPPHLDYTLLRRLWLRKPVDLATLTSKNGIEGVLVPGVDGDFAGIYLRHASSWTLLQRSLELACDRAGMDFELVPESELRRTPWLRATRRR